MYVCIGICVCVFVCVYLCGAAAQRGLWPPHSRGFRDHTHDAPQSAGFFWTSDQSVSEISTWQQKHSKHSQQTYIHASGGIRNDNLSRRATVDLRLRPRGHWWPAYIYIYILVYQTRSSHAGRRTLGSVSFRTHLNYDPRRIKALLSDSVNVVGNSWGQLTEFDSERSSRAYCMGTIGNLPKFDSGRSEKNKEWWAPIPPLLFQLKVCSNTKS
jgi:hypothetical protein